METTRRTRNPCRVADQAATSESGLKPDHAEIREGWAARDRDKTAGALEVAEGNVEASLGGGVYKKRIALPGKGKSGGARTLVAFKKGEHTFYLHGFNKNERSNISQKELRALKSAANVWFSKLTKELKKAERAGALVELMHEDKL